MLSIFLASCCISLILWCMLFSWRGQSSGPEALKEECGMGKSEQSEETKLLYTANRCSYTQLVALPSWQTTNKPKKMPKRDLCRMQWHWQPKHFCFCFFFWFKRNEANTKLVWIQVSQCDIIIKWLLDLSHTSVLIIAQWKTFQPSSSRASKPVIKFQVY